MTVETAATTTVVLDNVKGVPGGQVSLPTGLFINNAFVPSVSGKTFATVNPTTGKVICNVHEGDAKDVDIAVKAAQSAFPIWSQKTDAYTRGQRIYKLADLIERDADLIAAIESMDNGKHIMEARLVDVAASVKCLRYYAGWADKIDGRVVQQEAGVVSITRHEPFGVVGQIIPFPLMMMAWKLGPALATGNVIVMKTSEKTPLSALKVCQLIVEAGFPPGVVNVISGFGATAGEAIARHKHISKVAFTGSTAVGRKVMIAAAESNLKKVSLELGGKSPNIVFEDADLELAAKASTMGFTANQGQCCCAGTRVYVQEGVYDAFLEKLKYYTGRINVETPCETGFPLGPIVDTIQFDRVMGYIQDGKAEGAHVEVGGVRVGQEGYYVAPTVFSGVTDDMKIAREEIFGPVVVVMKFKTADEILERANNSNYGLAAAIHTKDLNLAHRMAAELQSGTVWINCYNKLHHAVPFGGYKESGIGRELGEYGLREYTQIKAVVTQLF